ncbi:MAG: hypothetical protein ACJ8F7_11555, partial [Gemmataceae bacterium]
AAPPEPPPAPPPPLPATAWDRMMDRWNDAVKDAMLDRPDPDENEFASPDEDQPLAALDHDRFTTALHERFAEVAVHIADTLTVPRTDFELAKTEDEVGRFLHEFRWDALTLALDLRTPGVAPEAPPPVLPHATPRPPRHSDAWARKYRRMRALGS